PRLHPHIPRREEDVTRLVKVPDIFSPRQHRPPRRNDPPGKAATGGKWTWERHGPSGSEKGVSPNTRRKADAVVRAVWICVALAGQSEIWLHRALPVATLAGCSKEPRGKYRPRRRYCAQVNSAWRAPNTTYGNDSRMGRRFTRPTVWQARYH